MMKHKWLLVLGAAVLLAGCVSTPPCKPPGEKGDTGPCFFLLTITKNDSNDSEVRGRVAKIAVEANIWQQPKFDTPQKIKRIRSYPFIEYPFHVSGKDKETLMPGKDYLFVRQSGASILQLTTEDDIDLPPYENAPSAIKSRYLSTD